MKHLILLLSVSLIGATRSLTQDIIVKNNKEQVEAKVIEVDDISVKYRLWAEKQDGPLYTIKKPDIFMIIYQNGRRETFSSAPVNIHAGAGASNDATAPSSAGEAGDRPSLSGFNPGNYYPAAEKLDVMNGVTRLNILFDYSSMLVNDMPEAEYIKKMMEHKGADADKWLSMWKSDRINFSEPSFATSFVVGSKAPIRIENASVNRYTLLVKFIKILTERPGFGGANAVVTTDAYIVETGHPENIIARLGDSYTARVTGDWMTGGYSLKARLQGCYVYMAVEYAGRLRKQLKKRGLYR
ncbi:MAG TPA: hypothetical protein VL832_07580 [Puia sp.]|nr:hypothetical protein [Puia sp.]